MYILEADRKAFFSFSAVNENADKNEIPFMTENETKTKMDIHFERKKRKRKSPDNISVFSFHTFSHQVCLTMRSQYLVQFRLFTGGPC